jgi:alpha-galactosidase
MTGRAALRLVITNAGDNFTSDHGDWADAKLTCG